MNTKNKLRPGKNKSIIIYASIISGLILLSAGMFIAYMYINYENSLSENQQFIYQIMNFFSYLTDNPSPTVAVTPTVIATALKYQVTKLWWMYIIAALIIFMSTTNTKDEYKGMEHGSASWSDKYAEKLFKDPTGIPVALDTYITVANPKKKYYSSHNLNEVVIGGSGAGKSFRKIKPDIMQMFGSYVVTDPKGELYRDTAKFLSENGYKIRVLNLININFSNSYNPFSYMSEEQDVLNVADLFMKNSAGEGEKEDFWTGAAQDMLVAIMVYLWKTPYELKTFGRVVRLVNSVQYKDSKIDELCELAMCLKRHVIDYPNDVASVNWASIQGTPQETLGSICKTLSTRLRLWAVESVDELTSTDEMDFDMIGKEKTAVFLIIPAARQTYKVIANIFYSQLFERLMLVANRDCNGRLPYLVSCELDEFPNIGKIPNYNETVAVVRSHNIRICMVLQGLSQLKALYEKTWESIIGNCSIFTFLGTNDMDSREYVSKKLGKTTVRVDSRSYNRGGNCGGGSDSESYIQRDLLAPDEILQAIKPKGKNKKFGGCCIIFVDEFKPFFIPKYDTLHHPLINITGSSFEKDFVNNTSIESVYASVKEERSKVHKQSITDFFAIAEEKKKQDIIKSDEEKNIKEKLKQQELAARYADTDIDIIDEDEFENQISADVNPIIAKFNVD
ncbi:MAG: type IV secretory system conjugative DNA transfer family protein [Oscillospiraceae bacterium]|nr:type IV secretory system conjugative DNA transfer family protein [Oscillospiraceae bacterium]